jgi:putative tryptophan/tyrosine transport system substrate-binding protein
MRRREFIALLGGSATAWPFAAHAQQSGERMRRIGILMNTAASKDQQANVATFIQVLQQLGWIEGRNLQIDIRWAGGDPTEIRKQAEGLVARAPEVILVTGNAGMPPLLRATRTVPIIFNNVADPVGAGYVDTMARPGGNATGFIQFEYSLSGKWPGLAQGNRPKRHASGCPSGCHPRGWDWPIRRHSVGGTIGWDGGECNRRAGRSRH